MNGRATLDAYGALTEPSTLKIERLLAGPIERVWAYLTESDLRRKWLAAGEMQMKAGTPFELVWRNDQLTNPPGKAPPGKSDEHRAQGRILSLDPPRKLAFEWEGAGEVSIELKQRGNDQVMLTLIHRRLPDRSTKVGASAGWHMHLDVLVARLSGSETEPFWEGMTRLLEEYERRLPA